MPDSNQMGINRTGMDMSPRQAKDMLKGAKLAKAGPIRYDALERIRRTYLEEGESLGTVPVPGKLRGALSTGMEKLKGHNPEVLTEPRTSVSQCLEALLIAELADNAAWELLQELCAGMGLQDMADGFEHAIEQEQVHAVTVTAWLREITLRQGGADGASAG